MESGEILDEQITASSVWPGDHHAAHHGRLNFQEHVFDPRVVGSWSARKKDENQWLQVDLLRGESVVTSVATQGRNSHPKWPWGVRNQWVKNYKLQYSNNGVNFKYYKDQRQNSAKVRLKMTSIHKKRRLQATSNNKYMEIGQRFALFL